VSRIVSSGDALSHISPFRCRSFYCTLHQPAMSGQIIVLPR
jgi:hypothetical protein